MTYSRNKRWHHYRSYRNFKENYNFVSLDKINKFLEGCKSCTLKWEDTENINSNVSIKIVKVQLRSFCKGTLNPDNFIVVYKTFKEKVMPILHKLFQELEEDGTSPKPFHEVIGTLVPKPDRKEHRVIIASSCCHHIIVVVSMCPCPIVITDYCELGGLKSTLTEFISLRKIDWVLSKSSMGLNGLKSRCWQTAFLSGASGVESTFLHFPASKKPPTVLCS